MPPDTTASPAMHDSEISPTQAQSLEDDEASIRSLLRLLPGLFLMFDETGQLLRWNRELERRCGLSPQEIVAMRAWEFVAPEQREAFRHALASAFRRGHFEIEINLQTRSENGLPCLLTGKRVRLGGQHCVLAVGMDVGERRASQEALRESEERLRLVSMVTSDVIWDWNLETDATWHNNGLQTVFGYTRADNVRDWFEHLHPDDRERVRQSITAHARSGHGFWESRYRLRRGDGSYAQVHDRGLVLHDDFGKPLRMVGAMVDISEQVKAEERISQYEQQVVFLARHNPLTGLPAKQVLDEQLATALCSAEAGALAVLAIDLDGFKLINESFGDAVGDDLLQQYAQTLVRHASAGSSVYHVASDSFCVVLQQNAAAQAAPALAQHLLRTLEQPFASRDQELYLSACIGIALFPEHGTDAVSLIRNANTALSRAKQRAPNASELYSPEMRRASADMMLLGTKLRRAIKQGELVLDYQPYVDLDNGQILGVEALVRWQHPELGLIPPARFIPVAEETGLIVPLGDWVLRVACRQMATWQQAGHSSLHLAVNISVRQLRQADFVDQVAAAVLENGLAPHTLVLEITESVMMNDPEQMQGIFAQLHELGVDIAVDDFGTGYSSLSYINTYRVDYLKIDRSFVSGLPADEDQASIARAIIAMARHLHIKVIAEGVETRDQHRLLCALGCEQAQGYLYGRPQSSAAVSRMLEHPPES